MKEAPRSHLGPREQAALDLALPSHMLWLCADLLRADGWRLREDIFLLLSQAAGAALKGLNKWEVWRTSVKIEEVGIGVIRDMSFDDPRDGLVSCAALTLKLVDEKLFADSGNQAVLVSLLIMNDAQDSGSEMPFHQEVLSRNVGTMLFRLRMYNCYQKLVLPPAPR
jgi:hypothetical protein